MANSTFQLILILFATALAGPSQAKESNRTCTQALSALVWNATAPVRLGYKVEKTARKYLNSETSPTWHFQHEKGLLGKSLRLAEDLTNPTLRFLFPGILNRLDGPTRGIFRKQWVDPSYKPTEHEIELLKKYGAWDAFNERKIFLEKHPVWSRSRRIFGSVVDLLFKGIWLTAFNHAAQQLSDGRAIDHEDFASGEKKRTDEGEIQLLIESVPLPHMAIRIDNRVYSYGFTHLQVNSLAEYVLARDLAEALEQATKDHPELHLEKDEATSSAKIDERLHGLAKGVSRTIQVVTLNVGKQKKDEIRRYLELNAWKQYYNETLVNDCSTMSLRAIGQESRFIDPSPSATGMCFSLRKTLGDSTVKDVFLVKDGRASSDLGLVGRNTLINVWDSSMHMRSLPFTAPIRARIDSTFTDEDFQHYGETAKEIIASWRDEVAESIQNDPHIKMHQEIVERFKQFDGTANQKEKFREMAREQLESDFDEYIESANKTLNSPSVTLRSYWVAKYNLELLPQYRAKFLKDLK